MTPFGNLLLTTLVALLSGSLINIYYQVPFINVLISGGSAAICAAYIAYDTQLIIGGKHKKRSYNAKEYILASLGLYQDLISLFLQIVSLLDRLEQPPRGGTGRRGRGAGEDKEL